MKYKTKISLWGYAFIAPQLVGMIIFSLLPLVFSLGLAFFKWDFMGKPVFVGMGNFIHQFHDETFLISIKNTLLFVIYTVPLGVVVAMILAVCVNKVMCKTFFRAIFFAPVITSGVAVSLMWIWMYNKDFGIINYVLTQIGMQKVDWLGNPSTVLPALVVVSVWGGCGYDMVIYLSGMQQVPKVYYEAAEIDGAGGFTKFFYITLPLMTPTVFFMVIMSIIGTFQSFDRIAVMTQGGPLNASRTMVFDIYENAFKFSKFGEGTASAMVLFVIILSITILQNVLSKHWVNYDME